MKLKKRILSTALAGSMIFGSALTFAADLDVKNIKTNEITTSGDYLFDDAKFSNIIFGLNDYLIEVDGQYYSAKQVSDATEDKTPLKEAVKNLTPVAEVAPVVIESVDVSVNEGRVATITAVIKNSEAEDTATVTIKPDSSLGLEDIVIENVTIDGNGNLSQNAGPLPVGNHVATVTVGGASKSVDFTVVEEDALKVESVSAINSKNVEVKFNKEVKEVKPANFKVTDKNGNLLFVSKAELNEAKNAATLSFFDAFADKGVYTVETSNVADVDGNLMAKSTDQFGYEKAEVAKVEFTSKSIKVGGKLADVVKVTDKLGRDVTAENVVEFASANTDIIGNDGIAKAGQDGKEVLVTATVKDTTVSTKAVIKVSNSSAKTFVGYTADTNVPADTDAFNKLEADKKYDYVSVSDKDNTGSGGTDDRKTLAVYALDQYGKSINKITAFDSVENLTPNVVIVSATDGKITPISEGTGFVKVKSGDVEQTVKINVRAAARVQNIEVDPSEVNIVEKGLDGKIKLTYKDQFGGNTAGNNANLTVKSSDTAVATVSKDDASNITVKGLKKGTANVILTYKYKVGTEDVVIEKVVPVTVSEKGSFADYKVEVARTTLYSEDDTDTTTVDETNVDVKVYELDDKGQKIGVATGTSLQARKLDAEGKEVDDAGTAVTINGLNVAYKAAGTQKVQVKVGSVVVDTIEFTTINNTPGIANTVVFDNNAIVINDLSAADNEAKNINKQLAKNVTLKDKFGDKLEQSDVDAGTIDFEYTITNKDGVTFGGSANAETIDKVTKQNSSADIVVTKVTFTPSNGSATDNLLASPQVVKLSVKQIETPAPAGMTTTEGSNVASAMQDITAANAEFLVAGLLNNMEDPSSGEKRVTLAVAKEHIDAKYGVNFNADAIKIENGKLSIVGQILSPADWYKVKENGNATIPYRISLLKNGAQDTNSSNRALRIAMYSDGKAILEDGSSQNITPAQQ